MVKYLKVSTELFELRQL